MLTKRALIVDDSRLARHVLSRLLTEHGLAADTAESAEAALDYLKGHRPDVVFLDHNMPGMDGFEALEAIKANPITATIPVMMYTSQEGELYLGQARALGALGVLPKSMEPVEVTKVLRSLHLIPVDKAAQPPPPQQQPAAPLPDRRFDNQRLRELLEELFYEQGSVLRDEIRKEFQRLSVTMAPAPLPPVSPPKIVQPPVERNVFRLASGLLLVLAAVLGYMYLATSSLLEQAYQQTRSLADDTRALSAVSTKALDTRQVPSTDRRGVLDVLEWGINQGGQFAFGEVPLNNERAYALTALIEQLERIDFAGLVVIEVHVGRFCMNYGANGMLALAPPEQPAAICEQVGWSEVEAETMGEQQSLAFANAISTTSIRSSGDIRVDILSYGISEPLVTYPLSGYDITAGAWNAIAADNQRVHVRLVPAADPNERTTLSTR